MTSLESSLQDYAASSSMMHNRYTTIIVQVSLTIAITGGIFLLCALVLFWYKKKGQTTNMASTPQMARKYTTYLHPDPLAPCSWLVPPARPPESFCQGQLSEPPLRGGRCRPSSSRCRARARQRRAELREPRRSHVRRSSVQKFKMKEIATDSSRLFFSDNKRKPDFAEDLYLFQEIPHLSSSKRCTLPYQDTESPIMQCVHKQGTFPWCVRPFVRSFSSWVRSLVGWLVGPVR